MTAPTGNETELRDALKATGRRYVRLREALQAESEKLIGLVLQANKAEMRPADIARSAQHAFTPEYVRKIIRKAAEEGTPEGVDTPSDA